MKKTYITLGVGVLVLLILLAAYPTIRLSYLSNSELVKYFFTVDLPADFKAVQLSAKEMDLHGNPHFRYQVSESQFAELKRILQENGYSEWTKSGGSFGLFNEESREGDPLLMSQKIKGHWQLMFFYRPSTGTLDAVSFFN